MLADYSVRVLLGGIGTVVVIMLIASSIHHRFHFTKKAFFTVVSGIILSVSASLLLINLKLLSVSDESSITSREGYLSIAACDQQIRIYPKSSLLAQSSGDAKHSVFPDGKMVFLGYRTDAILDGSLGGFFEAMGGSITTNSLALPLSAKTRESINSSSYLQKFIRTNPIGEEYLELRSGETCDTTPSMLSVFIYDYNPVTHEHIQKRIIGPPQEYLLSDNDFGKPDCVVVVFGEPSERTQFTCNGYPDINKVIFSETEI